MSLLFQLDHRRVHDSDSCTCKSHYLTWLHSLAQLLHQCVIGGSPPTDATSLTSLLPPATSIVTAVDHHQHLPPPPPPYTPLSNVAECSQWWFSALRELSVRTDVFVPRVILHVTANDAVARAMAIMLCDDAPLAVADLVRHNVALLRRLFADQSIDSNRLSQRVNAFFANFEWNGQHRLGSEPLARFLMLHRDRCWSRLQWLGNRRGVPPPVAAHKPQSFLQLDALHAVATLLRDDDSFWRFPPLVDALLCPELVQLDPEFFVDELIAMLRRDNDPRALAAARDLLARVDASTVCARILVHLSPQELTTCLNGVASSTVHDAVAVSPRHVRQVQVFFISDVRWLSFNAMILCWALVSRLRVLMSFASSEHAHWRAVLVAWSERRRAHVDRAVLCCGHWKLCDHVLAERDRDTRMRFVAGLLALEGVALSIDMASLGVDAGDVLLRTSGSTEHWRAPAAAGNDRKRGRDSNAAADGEWSLRDEAESAHTFVFGASELAEQAVYQWQRGVLRRTLSV